MLDFSARQTELGKSVGDDFRDGKVTLPILVAFARGDEEERAFWRRTIEEQDQRAGDLERAIRVVERRGALAETLSRARAYAASAIDALSLFRDGAERRALIGRCRLRHRARFLTAWQCRRRGAAVGYRQPEVGSDFPERREKTPFRPQKSAFRHPTHRKYQRLGHDLADRPAAERQRNGSGIWRFPVVLTIWHVPMFGNCCKSTIAICSERPRPPQGVAGTARRFHGGICPGANWIAARKRLYCLEARFWL